MPPKGQVKRGREEDEEAQQPTTKQRAGDDNDDEEDDVSEDVSSEGAVDDEDEDDEEGEDEVTTAQDTKYSELVEALGAEGYEYVHLKSEAYEPDADPATITRESILAVEHLLLPTEAFNVAATVVQGSNDLLESHEGDDDEVPKLLWDNVLVPAVKAAVKSLGEGKYLEAFGHLLGLWMYSKSDKLWILDNDAAEVGKFVDGLSEAWKQVLALSDAQLGLAPAVGIPGGYRNLLKAQLKLWESSVNRVIRSEYSLPGPKGYLRIETTSEADEVSSEEEDDDEEDFSGEDDDGVLEDNGEDGSEGEGDEEEDEEDDECTSRTGDCSLWFPFNALWPHTTCGLLCQSTL